MKPNLSRPCTFPPAASRLPAAGLLAAASWLAAPAPALTQVAALFSDGFECGHARRWSDPSLPVKGSVGKPDFNGDGWADLAIGVPGEFVTTNENEGAVQVLYGGPSGLQAAGSQIWHRNGGFDDEGNFLGDLQEQPRANDRFGAALATGDFNGDCFADLAVGVPESEAATKVNAGVVQVLYGSPDGLRAAGNQVWAQHGGWTGPEGDGSGLYTGDIYGGPEDDDRFGNALTSGDFDGDGYADLAIGVFKEDIGSVDGAGAVNVLFGSAQGLTWVGNQFFSQDDGVRENGGTGTYVDLGDLIGGAEAGDFFGHALAAGDFDGDGHDDLAVGAWGEGIGALGDAGAVNIIPGSASGLTTVGNEHWHQQAAYLDTIGNGLVDVTIGDPDGTEEASDWFGYSLAAGDFDGNGFADLAVGVPQEDLWIYGIELSQCGATQVFYGSASGLSLGNAQWWQQDGEYSIGPMNGSPVEEGDRFGASLTTGDIDGDGYADLAVGAPNESFAELGAEVGSVNVIFGGPDGLDVPGHQWFSLGIGIGDDGSQLGSLVGEASAFDRFGAALEAADFDGHGDDELAIGIPGYSPAPSSTASGAVVVVPGFPDGLTVVGNQLWDQDGGWDSLGNFLGDLYDNTYEYEGFGAVLP